MELERITLIEPAYNKVHPDPSKNYGRHGANLRMVLKGSEGAIQFLIYTQWFLKKDYQELFNKLPWDMMYPQAVDIGYHSPRPMYDEQTLMDENCPYTSTGKCFYDGSSLHAEPYLDALIEEGSDRIWEMMTEKYKQTFS